MRTLQKALRPINYGSPHVEDFDRYASRCASLLPHFPVDVLESWIYRHYDDAFRAYGWLPLSELRFERCAWPTLQIISSVEASDARLIASWKQMLIQKRVFQRSWLGEYMLEHGTWNVPPVVISNPSRVRSPKGEMLYRYHLAEGHHRLAYLHALEDYPEWTPKSEHELWVVSLPL